MKYRHSIKIDVLIGILIATTIIVCAIYYISSHRVWFDNRNEGIMTTNESIKSLPSLFDIQEELNRRGCNLKVDGKLGPKTMAAWDKELCNDYATKAINQAMKGE